MMSLHIRSVNRCLKIPIMTTAAMLRLVVLLNASPRMYWYTIVKQTPPGFVNVGSSTIFVNTSAANVLNIRFNDQHPISAPSVCGCLYRYFLLGSISRSVKEDTNNNDSEDTNLVGSVTVTL